MGISIIEDEIDKKRRQLVEQGYQHRNGNFDPLAVKNPKPGRVYRAAYNDPRRVAELQSEGYTLSKEEFAVNAKKDGGNTYKDVILMDCNQDSHIERQAKYRSQLDAQSIAIRNGARENLNRILRDDAGQPSHKDHTFDETHTGPTTNKVEMDD